MLWLPVLAPRARGAFDNHDGLECNKDYRTTQTVRRLAPPGLSLSTTRGTGVRQRETVRRCVLVLVVSAEREGAKGRVEREVEVLRALVR
jgi:hypothetical protein